MATKFKKGDKIIGNAHANKHYSTTVKGWKGTVVDVMGRGKIQVKGYGGDLYVVMAKCFDLVESKVVSKPKPKSKEYNVDPKFIRDAHKAACSDWKKKIETKFPEVFKPKTPEAFTFSKKRDNAFSLTANWNGPLTVGWGLAPDNLKGKCLAVHPDYKMEVKTKDGYQILVFRKK